jgi:hypothetical protein
MPVVKHPSCQMLAAPPPPPAAAAAAASRSSHQEVRAFSCLTLVLHCHLVLISTGVWSLPKLLSKVRNTIACDHGNMWSGRCTTFPLPAWRSLMPFMLQDQITGKRIASLGWQSVLRLCLITLSPLTHLPSFPSATLSPPSLLTPSHPNATWHYITFIQRIGMPHDMLCVPT